MTITASFFTYQNADRTLLLSTLHRISPLLGTKRTWSVWLTMSALEGKAELEQRIPK
jgi:hypothetical protein